MLRPHLDQLYCDVYEQRILTEAFTDRPIEVERYTFIDRIDGRHNINEVKAYMIGDKNKTMNIFWTGVTFLLCIYIFFHSWRHRVG